MSSLSPFTPASSLLPWFASANPGLYQQGLETYGQSKARFDNLNNWAWAATAMSVADQTGKAGIGALNLQWRMLEELLKTQHQLQKTQQQVNTIAQKLNITV